MNSHPKLSKWLEQRKQAQHHRQLLVISGEEQWCIQTAKSIIQAQDENINSSTLAVGVPELTSNIKTKQYRQYLGHEFNTVIYNAWQGIRANALSALAGTVQKGGLMLLLCPSLKSWPEHKDPELTERISFGYVENFHTSYFVKWLISCIQNDESVCLVSENDIHFFQAKVAQSEIPTKVALDGTQPLVTQCQASAIKSIIKVATGHRGRPLVLQADRGRGKSSALGIAAAQLTKQFDKSIIITAPLRSQCQQAFTFFENCDGLLEKLQFVAIDKLLEEEHDTDLLIIDEAAAVPATLLSQLCRRYKRLVFSTTVHGYEGSGKGFDIRFKPLLLSQFPQTRIAHLTSPLRWFEQDPLEAFWFNVFCQQSVKEGPNSHTKKQVTPKSTLKCPTSDAMNCEARTPDLQNFTGALSPNELVHSPNLLQQIFSLLIEAHYQTTPDTLASMLESPTHVVFANINEGEVDAAAIASVEGGELLAPLAEEISFGERRPNGHLLAQKLTYTMAQPSLCYFQYLRVIRIAVKHNERRKSIGSLLLTEIERYSQKLNFDFVGASFGLDKGTLSFWLNNEYNIVDVGLRKETATGEHNAIVLKQLITPENVYDSKTTEKLNSIRHRFRSHYLHHLNSHFKTMPSSVVQLVLSGLLYNKQRDLSSYSNEDDKALQDSTFFDSVIAKKRNLMTQNDKVEYGVPLQVRHEVALFSQGKRDLNATLYALNQLAAIPNIYKNLSPESSELLIKFALQGYSATELRHLQLVSGKKELERILRNIVRG